MDGLRKDLQLKRMKRGVKEVKKGEMVQEEDNQKKLNEYEKSLIKVMAEKQSRMT